MNAIAYPRTNRLLPRIQHWLALAIKDKPRKSRRLFEHLRAVLARQQSAPVRTGSGTCSTQLQAGPIIQALHAISGLIWTAPVSLSGPPPDNLAGLLLQF